MSNIVELGEYRIKTERHSPYTGCQHKHFTMDDNGEIVLCADCGKQVSAYFMLKQITEGWDRAIKLLNAKQEKINAGVSTLAAQQVERSWKSRNMVPICPHCSEPIYPSDGFGSTSINREIADRRRSATGKAQP